MLVCPSDNFYSVGVLPHRRSGRTNAGVNIDTNDTLRDTQIVTRRKTGALPARKGRSPSMSAETSVNGSTTGSPSERQRSESVSTVKDTKNKVKRSHKKKVKTLSVVEARMEDVVTGHDHPEREKSRKKKKKKKVKKEVEKELEVVQGLSTVVDDQLNGDTNPSPAPERKHVKNSHKKKATKRKRKKTKKDKERTATVRKETTPATTLNGGEDAPPNVVEVEDETEKVEADVEVEAKVEAKVEVVIDERESLMLDHWNGEGDHLAADCAFGPVSNLQRAADERVTDQDPRGAGTGTASNSAVPPPPTVATSSPSARHRVPSSLTSPQRPSMYNNPYMMHAPQQDQQQQSQQRREPQLDDYQQAYMQLLEQERYARSLPGGGGPGLPYSQFSPQPPRQRPSDPTRAAMAAAMAAGVGGVPYDQYMSMPPRFSPTVAALGGIPPILSKQQLEDFMRHPELYHQYMKLVEQQNIYERQMQMQQRQVPIPPQLPPYFNLEQYMAGQRAHDSRQFGGGGGGGGQQYPNHLATAFDHHLERLQQQRQQQHAHESRQYDAARGYGSMDGPMHGAYHSHPHNNNMMASYNGNDPRNRGASSSSSHPDVHATRSRSSSNPPTPPGTTTSGLSAFSRIRESPVMPSVARSPASMAARSPLSSSASLSAHRETEPEQRGGPTNDVPTKANQVASTQGKVDGGGGGDDDDDGEEDESDSESHEESGDDDADIVVIEDETQDDKSENNSTTSSKSSSEAKPETSPDSTSPSPPPPVASADRSRRCKCKECQASEAKARRAPADAPRFFPEFTDKAYEGAQGHVAAIKEIVIPALARFDPELISISAGFDGHWRDPLGHRLGMNERNFFEESKLVVDFAKASKTCRGRVVSVLEGGYDVVAKPKKRGPLGGSHGALADSAVAHVCAMSGVEYED
jgi:hypothetical protein